MRKFLLLGIFFSVISLSAQEIIYRSNNSFEICTRIVQLISFGDRLVIIENTKDGYFDRHHIRCIDTSGSELWSRFYRPSDGMPYVRFYDDERMWITLRSGNCGEPDCSLSLIAIDKDGNQTMSATGEWYRDANICRIRYSLDPQTGVAIFRNNYFHLHLVDTLLELEVFPIDTTPPWEVTGYPNSERIIVQSSPTRWLVEDTLQNLSYWIDYDSLNIKLDSTRRIEMFDRDYPRYSSIISSSAFYQHGDTLIILDENLDITDTIFIPSSICNSYLQYENGYYACRDDELDRITYYDLDYLPLDTLFLQNNPLLSAVTRDGYAAYNYGEESFHEYIITKTESGTISYNVDNIISLDTVFFHRYSSSVIDLYGCEVREVLVDSLGFTITNHSDTALDSFRFGLALEHPCSHCLFYLEQSMGFGTTISPGASHTFYMEDVTLKFKPRNHDMESICFHVSNVSPKVDMVTSDNLICRSSDVLTSSVDVLIDLHRTLVYPNPSNGSVYFDTDLNLADAQLVVYNQEGVQVHASAFTPQRAYEFDFPSGIYYY